MRVIIAGTRDLVVPYNELEEWISKSGFPIKEVVSGHSGNIDLLGETWAARNNVPVAIFLPRWKLFGKAAGPKRNKEMADYADALIAFWDGKSKGTYNMIKEMTILNKPSRTALCIWG